jgi:hypothetical protein
MKLATWLHGSGGDKRVMRGRFIGLAKRNYAGRRRRGVWAIMIYSALIRCFWLSKAGDFSNIQIL